ncbi:MAG: response regulator transcription factor [Pseudomonadota bacterium]
MRILVIEDDASAAAHVVKGLRGSGHSVDLATDGEAGLMMAEAGGYDAFVVDRMVPKADGLSVVRKLRASGDDTPALFLSALGELNHRVEGFDAGGDDYLPKPYAFAELLARVEALGRRRAAPPKQTVLSTMDLELDLLTRAVRRGGQRIDLQPREFKLLSYLLRHAGRIVTRAMLLENVWGYHFDPQTNVIDVHISRLRSKIDKGFDTPLLETVRGSGYRLRADG